MAAEGGKDTGIVPGFYNDTDKASFMNYFKKPKRQRGRPKKKKRGRPKNPPKKKETKVRITLPVTYVT